MDKYSVKLMSRALRDLDGVYGYIAHTTGAGDGPQSGRPDRGRHPVIGDDALPLPGTETRAYANRGYRQLFVENYTVVFRIDEAKKTVIVVTVRYSPSEF